MEKERIIKDRLQRLIERIKNADWKDCDRPYMARLAKERINELRQRGVYYVDRFVQKLLDRVDDKEAYLDILMEGRFAIILARLGFSKIHIEYCDKGPDMKASWNRNTVYFEVTRIRPNDVDRAAQSGVAVISPDEAPSIIWGKIQQKLRQLKSNEVNIVVIWGDTFRVDPTGLKEASKYIKQEIDENEGTYTNLSAILFTEGEESYTTTLKRFHLFINEKASKLLRPRLTKKLEFLHERDLKQLQREMDELAAALKRLHDKGNS